MLVYSDSMTDTPKQPDQTPPDEKPKVRKELTIISVPDDRDMIAEEMAEMFEEVKDFQNSSASEAARLHTSQRDPSGFQ
jgi:hypothetical protein